VRVRVCVYACACMRVCVYACNVVVDYSDYAVAIFNILFYALIACCGCGCGCAALEEDRALITTFMEWSSVFL
jgi:hypothetical protein